jgi:hypothetical protein
MSRIKIRLLPARASVLKLWTLSYSNVTLWKKYSPRALCLDRHVVGIVAAFEPHTAEIPREVWTRC